ncbi:Maternal effect lethal protein 47 [Toxocara canis]|uniref:Maternal effect lethal protein 47 n=1 Tax=Toxocara canis TaxID=6265 RepID=A0A0B2VMR8_TOXCA|nr:Maternal effect lethal protein 47 [Toxocara canis]
MPDHNMHLAENEETLLSEILLLHRAGCGIVNVPQQLFRCGQRLEMHHYTARENRSERQLPFVGEPHEKCLYVNCVPSAWDEWRLFDVFRRFGIINNIKLVRNTENQRYSYGFVDMMTLADLDRIMDELDLNGHLHVEGLKRPLGVKRAHRKQEQKTNEGGGTVLKDGNEQLKRNSRVVIRASSEDNNYKRLSDGQQKRGELHRSNKIAWKGDEGNRCWVSALDRDYRPLPKHGSFDAIRFCPAIHRCCDLPLGRIIPVNVVVSRSGIYSSPPLFYAFLKESDVEEDKKLQEMLERQFLSTDPLDHVDEQELVVVKREVVESNESCLLRALVIKVKSDYEVVVFAVDTGERLIAPLSNLRPFTEALLQFFFKAIPCSLYGISNIQEGFAELATCNLKWANLNAKLRAKVICFDGFFTLVELLVTEGEGDDCVTYDFGQKLAESNLCAYSPPTNERVVYSREEMLQLAHSLGKTVILNEELAKAIGI